MKEKLEQLYKTISAEIQKASTVAELEEVNAYMESIKTMLQSNIQEDFNYGLNQ